MRLPTSSYGLPSRNASRLLNCFAVASTVKGPVEIQGTPGVVSYRVLDGVGRGMAVQGSNLYALVGTTLYNVGTGATVGTIPGSGTVMFAPGVTQMVTDTGHILSGSTVSAITDADRPTFSSVGFIDGYLTYTEADSGRFGCSALNDSSDYDALDYATAEGQPDLLVTHVVSQREAVLLGTKSYEIWWNAGESGFPFLRQAGGYGELGCLARLGAVSADNSVFWLASDRTIRRLSGRTPVKVSQSGVEEALASYSTLADCEAYSYTWQGIVHVCFRFPSQSITWNFNVNTGEWYETDTDWVTAVNHDGKVWVQHLDGTVGYLSDSVQSQFGSAVIREVTFPNVYNGNARAFHSSLEIVMRTGDVDPNVTPYLQLDISDDGGNTWTQLPPRELGATGKYSQIVRWFRLGSARDRVYRIRCSDAVPFYVTDARLEVVG